MIIKMRVEFNSNYFSLESIALETARRIMLTKEEQLRIMGPNLRKKEERPIEELREYVGRVIDKYI